MVLDPASSSSSRPRRKAANSHKYRYLQTRNPSRLEEIDLKRALEASLDNSSSAASASSTSSTSTHTSAAKTATNQTTSNNSKSSSSRRRRTTATTKNTTNTTNTRAARNSRTRNPSQPNANHLHHHDPSSSYAYPNKYKPVANKEIYDAADFFHDGIMEYIEYELLLLKQNKKRLTV